MQKNDNSQIYTVRFVTLLENPLIVDAGQAY